MSKNSFKNPVSTTVTRNLLIAVWIIIAAIIIAGTVFVVGTVQQYSENETVPMTGISDQKTNATVLFVFKDDSYESEDLHFMLARFNTGTGSNTVVSVPASFTSEAYNHSGSLSKQYEYGGAVQVKAAIENLFSITIDKYIECPFTSLETAIDKLGGVEFDIPQNMMYKNSSGVIVTNLIKGKQTLNGKQFLQYIRYGDFGDVYKTAQKRTELALALIESVSGNEAYDKIVGMFNSVIDNCSSDITVIDISQFAEDYALGGSTVTAITLSGTETAPDAASIESVSNNF